jgi:hypothetical protein
MARFLSPEWFGEAARPAAASGSDDRTVDLVVEQVVTETPYGEIRYQVVVAAGSPRIVAPGDRSLPADLTFTSSWDTAVGIASGRLSAQRALMEGRLRVQGNLSLAIDATQLSGLDALPTQVRATTTF